MKFYPTCNTMSLRRRIWSEMTLALDAAVQLEWPRSMQAIDFDSQRWHVIGSWSPVAEPSANVPQPMN